LVVRSVCQASCKAYGKEKKKEVLARRAAPEPYFGATTGPKISAGRPDLGRMDL
jgi:hypothetical protein